jgi:hypothetical protein
MPKRTRQTTNTECFLWTNHADDWDGRFLAISAKPKRRRLGSGLPLRWRQYERDRHHDAIAHELPVELRIRILFDFMAVRKQRHGARLSRLIHRSIRRFWRTAGRVVGHRMDDVGHRASGRMLQVVDLTR